MKFEEAMIELRKGGKAYFGDVEPFDLDGMPNLTGGDMLREDWHVFESPLTDDELIARWDSEAEALEKEASDRELARLAEWETKVAELRAANPGANGDLKLPEKPRSARSSIAATLRRCSSALKARRVATA